MNISETYEKWEYKNFWYFDKYIKTFDLIFSSNIRSNRIGPIDTILGLMYIWFID